MGLKFKIAFMKKILLFCIVSVLLSSCSAKDEDLSDDSAVNDTATPQVEEGVIVVVGDEFSFTPSEISFKAGEMAKISFRNEGESMHNLVIEELGVESDLIGPGEVDYFEFTPDKSGSFEMICSIAGHKEAGMKGSLTIE